MLIIKADVMAGNRIFYVVDEAIELSKSLNIGIKFEFNGIECFVTPNSTEGDIIDTYYCDLDARREQNKLQRENDEVLSKCPWNKPIRAKYNGY